MTKQEITELFLRLCHETPGNTVDTEHPDWPDVAGLNMFTEPLIGFADADDALFQKYKEPGIVGPWMLTPKEWLPSAATVISVFMPFTERVKNTNALMDDVASHEWAYARIEGQAYLLDCLSALADRFRANGFEAVMPARDPRLLAITAGRVSGPGAAYADTYAPFISGSTFSSNWSERHTAFVCGLGTFGMSKGLITKKGVAGRFGSIIVSERIEPDARPYTEVYEYCTRCGACAHNCPVKAYPAPGELKDHRLCEPHITYSKQVLRPRYGCGLCQVNVPCRDGIPGRV